MRLCWDCRVVLVECPGRRVCRACRRLRAEREIEVRSLIDPPPDPDPPRQPLYERVVDGEVYDVMWNGAR